MKYLFSVYDKKADLFGPPFLAENEGVAVRMFEQMVMAPENMVSSYPEDFTLECIGTFDPATGVVERANIGQIATATAVMVASERKRWQEARRRAEQDPEASEVIDLRKEQAK